LVTLLRPYNADTITECIQCDPPPPVVHNGVEEYKEWILDNQVFRGRLECLVCWKGYGIKEDEWRLAEDIKGSKRLVFEFHHKNPEAPKHRSTLDFANLPFCPISKFTDTPDTIPTGWATGYHTLGCHAFSLIQILYQIRFLHTKHYIS